MTLDRRDRPWPAQLTAEHLSQCAEIGEQADPEWIDPEPEYDRPRTHAGTGHTCFQCVERMICAAQGQLCARGGFACTHFKESRVAATILRLVPGIGGGR
jgi:hypothetical protein